MKLLFATNNAHKLSELREILGDSFPLFSLGDAGFSGEIPEEQETLEGNALQKAHTVYRATGWDCFADDTGLEIEALGGAPGVYSARYAGEAHDAEANMEKVLSLLQNETNRKARFRTVIALILDGREFLFEGVVAGEILREREGTEGFGYDPIFRPEGEPRSFAAMSSEAKHRISHRGRAVARLTEFLRTLPR